MLRPYVGFVGGAYTARSKNFDAEECVNLYVEAAGVPTANSAAVLYGTPGLSLYTVLAGGGVRGAIKYNATTSYWVCGSNVYKIDSDGFVTLCTGSVTYGGTPVSLSSNGIVVLICSEPALFILDPTTDTVTQLTDPDFEGAVRVDFLRGVFLWPVPNTGRFQYTQIYSTDVDALDFGTAEGSPDNLITQIIDHEEAWFLGDSTTEVWSFTGDPDQAIQRLNGAFIEHGCVAKNSPAKMDNTIYWLGQDENGRGTVWKASGAYEPQRVSTHAVEYAIDQYSRISDAVAWTYQQEGHTFYVLNFPTGNATWVFDAATGLWHRRAYRDDFNQYHRHRGQCQIAFAGMNLVGDWENGNVYAMGLDTYTDNGALIPRVRVGPAVGCRQVNLLEIAMETGVGLVEGQGVDPQVMVQWSDDGGHNYGNEHWASAGRLGDFLRRVRYRRLGQLARGSKWRNFKMVITDPVKVAITGAWVDYQ